MSETAARGELKIVTNKNPHPAANRLYVAGIVTINGEKRNILLTGRELSVAIKRANKNPEDCLSESFWSELFN